MKPNKSKRITKLPAKLNAGVTYLIDKKLINNMSITKNEKKIQIVNWFPEWKGLALGRWKGSMRFIYDWSLVLGFIEIRKWHN
jgi:hypothetical protein